MTLTSLQLLIDFGLLVLIWMVQLLIYPSFQFYNEKDLIRWHKQYTVRIGGIVAPLMISQLFIAIWQVFQTPSFYRIGILILVFSVWIFTFAQFVPLHNKISKGTITDGMLQKLVFRNWLRTFLWSFIFVWGLVEFHISQ